MRGLSAGSCVLRQLRWLLALLLAGTLLALLVLLTWPQLLQLRYQLPQPQLAPQHPAADGQPPQTLQLPQPTQSPQQRRKPPQPPQALQQQRQPPQSPQQQRQPPQSPQQKRHPPQSLQQQRQPPQSPQQKRHPPQSLQQQRQPPQSPQQKRHPPQSLQLTQLQQQRQPPQSPQQQRQPPQSPQQKRHLPQSLQLTQSKQQRRKPVQAPRPLLTAQQLHTLLLSVSALQPPSPLVTLPLHRRKPLQLPISTPVRVQAVPLSIADGRRMSEMEASFPLAYWRKHKDDKNKYYKTKKCAPFPSFYELEFHNTYWQTLRTTNGTFHPYGAYLDTRNTTRIGPAVRILTVYDRIRPSMATYCQLWFEEHAAPVLVHSLGYEYVWYDKWGNHRDGVWQPYLITCVLPPAVRHLLPAAVSLVQQRCDRATNMLRVHYDAPLDRSQHEFAVCVKGLDFQHQDISVRLVEWIELVRLFGAHKIFFYKLQVHPNITKVLKYYEDLGVVSVTPFTMPGGQPNLPSLLHMYLIEKTTHKRQMEVIHYNDCLYRNMYHYRWLVLLDVDEVIVPLKDQDWSSLMRRVLPTSKPAAGQPPRSTYVASNLYFLDSMQNKHGWEKDVPRYMHMLRHVYRTRNFTSQYGKAFHKTDRVLALHNHFPLSCFGACSTYSLPPDVARLQHYRAECHTTSKVPCAELCARPQRDQTLWRWREPLLRRAKPVLRALALRR